jgi:3-methyladenine DNA glycosylase AlkD
VNQPPPWRVPQAAAAADFAADLLDQMRAQRNEANIAGMARFGISSAGTLGISVSQLRLLAGQLRSLRRERPMFIHDVAAQLWVSGVHEARILAGLIEVPGLVTATQADSWVQELDSWDVCDQLSKLFAATDFGYDKAVEWSGSAQEFVKRSGFVLMCALAVHDKSAADQKLIDFLPLIEQAASDERNFVKKAVNWALRQIGKRSFDCHAEAVACAERILAKHADSKAARWVARDALRELRSDAVLRRLG